MTTTVIALGLSQTLAFASTYYLPAILADPMAQEFGISPVWVFGAFTTAMLVSAALGPAAGRWIDAHGGRGILSVSSLVFAVGLLALSASAGRTTLFAAWIVIGLGMGIGLYDAAFATAARLYGRNARGPITGVTLIAGFASTVGWPFTAWMEAAYGWRTACIGWAALHLTLGLALHMLLVPRDGVAATAAVLAGASDGDAPQRQSPPQPQPDHRRTLVILAGVFGMIGFMSTSLSAHLPRVLELAGASPAAAVAAGALIGPAQVGARVIEFSLLRGVHPLWIGRTALLTHPVAAALLLLGGGGYAAAFAVVYGAGNGILTIVKGTLPLALFGPHGYGRRQGLINAPGRVVQALSPLVFGLIVEGFGVGALLVPAALGVVAFAALMMLRPEPTER
jgi:MFS family permease